MVAPMASLTLPTDLFHGHEASELRPSRGRIPDIRGFFGPASRGGRMPESCWVTIWTISY